MRPSLIFRRMLGRISVCHSPAPLGRASVLVVSAVVAACGSDAADAPAGSEAHAALRTPGVVASIFPVADLARAVGGDAVRVDVLLPPRASPATFEPTPRAVEILSRADLHVLVGGGLDQWATSVIEGASDADVVVLTRDAELVGDAGGKGSGNPHVWLDPIRARDLILPQLVDALARIAPDSAAAIRTRGRLLADTLTALHEEIDVRLQGVRARPFVTTHPAWVYFVDRYDLAEVGSIHGHPGQEPSARGLAALVETARRAGVRAVFTEPQVARTGPAALAAELGVPLVTLDPLGGPGLKERESYLALLRYNAAQIVRGLGDARG